MIPRRPFGLTYILFGLFLVATSSAAQTTTPNEAPIDRLRREISALEEKQCDPATTAITREEFARLVDPRDSQLSLLLEQEIADLRTAPLNTGITLTAEDIKTVNGLIAPIQAELDGLKSGRVVCDAPTVKPSAVGERNFTADQSHVKTVAAISSPPTSINATESAPATPAATPTSANLRPVLSSTPSPPTPSADPPQPANPPPAPSSGPCPKPALPYLSTPPVAGTRVITGCAKQTGDFVSVSIIDSTSTVVCASATYGQNSAPVNSATLMFSIELTKAQTLEKGQLICLKEVDSSGANPIFSVGPQQVQMWTYPEASSPWGRVRPYLSGGVVLSQNNGQFSSQNLFLGFDLDKNWFRVEHAGQLNWLLNTYFDAQLTSIPAASCQASSTTGSSSPSSCPASSGASGGSASTNNLTNFITSQKAAVVQGGIYVPIYFDSWKWSYNGNDNALFVGPIFKGGYQSLTGGSQTVTSPTPGSSTTISTLNNQSLYYFYAGGVRLGHYKLFNSWNIAPDLLSHLDILFGKWQNFEQQCVPSCTGPTTNVIPTMIALEGRLKIPDTFFQIGFDAISPLTKSSGTKGDLRFLFGVQLDPSCLFKAFQGTGTGSSLTTCAQGQSTSNAAPAPSTGP